MNPRERDRLVGEQVRRFQETMGRSKAPGDTERPKVGEGRNEEEAVLVFKHPHTLAFGSGRSGRN